MLQKIPLYYALPAILLSTLLVAAVTWAWTEPGVAPPGGNVPAPLNVGNIGQIKDAGISVGSFISRGGALLARDSGNVGIGTVTPTQRLDVNGYVRGSSGLCIGDDCRTSWPAGAGGGIGGSGTANYLTKFTASTTVGNSQIYDNGTNVGIGTVAPSTKLHVVGGARVTDLVSCDTIDTDASGNLVCGTDAGGAGGSWICTDHDGTGLGCSGDELYLNDDYFWGAEARCSGTDFLDGNGNCRSPAQIVSDGGGGGGSYSWDLYTDGTSRDNIVSGEDVGFDSGTGINVSWDGSRDVGFSLVDATKGCSAGQAIQSFDLSGTGNPTCVSAGGISSVVIRSCSTSGTTNAQWTCTATCPSGTYRTGCSGDYSIPNDGYFMNRWSVQPLGTDRCICNFDRAEGAANPSVSAHCWAYCAQ